MKKHETALFPALPPAELDAMWTLLEETTEPSSGSGSSGSRGGPSTTSNAFPDGPTLLPFEPSASMLDGFLGATADADDELDDASRSASLENDNENDVDTELDDNEHDTAPRRAQLEDNYERKKKRAKINRRDLHSRFQELMNLLHLHEDRKLNRAKVLEHAIEHIQRLTQELDAARAQLDARADGNANTSTLPMAMTAPPMPMPMPMAMPVPPPGFGANVNVMMMPYRVLPAATRRNPARAVCEKKPVLKVVPARRATGLKRSRPSSAQTASLFSYVMQELPCVLEFCDAWALAQLMATTRALRQATRRNELWVHLCQRRWHLQSTPLLDDAFSQWKKWHALHVMPVSASVRATTTTTFAAGSRAHVAVWACLVRRATGRTTRSVLYAGSPVVRQVVELTLVVQNLHPVHCVRLTNQFAVSSRDGTTFEPISALSGAHLTPTVVSKNDTACTVQRIDSVELGHGEFCVLSVFVDCNGLDLEQEFLERIEGVSVACEHWTHGTKQTSVWVQATTTEETRAVNRTKRPLPASTAETIFQC